VGGDFYDWVGPQAGQLDLTVADVMGKGVGAALVMATLRAALRSAPHELGPAARVGLASESISHGLTDEGLFVTLFHARLDLGTGVLRYVDAGHGYAAVLRAGGETVQLRSRSLPVGVMSETVYREEQVQLQPGDILLVYTDGLVEVGDQAVELRQLAEALEGAAGAEQMVGRLLDRVRGHQGDDVTVVALQRVATLVGARLASPSAGRPARHRDMEGEPDALARPRHNP
jgi:serine phosphatase RsbU (regulator of sigma subunit)